MARNGSWLTRSYNVVDFDPEIEKARQAFNKEPLQRNSELAVLAGLSGSTVNNLMGGKTRRPLHTTFAKLWGAMGFEYKAVRKEQPDYEKELVDARAEFKEYKVALQKKKAATKRRKK